MRLLLAEDDAMIGAAVRDRLRSQGFAVDWVRDGREADAALAGDVYDLLLLDLGLPGREGLAVLKALRGRGSTLPVVILTARDAVDDRVAGLDAGADDYVVKPFDLKELEARLRAVLRRRAGSASSVIEHGSLALDLAAHELRRDGVVVPVSPREFALLHAQLEERLYGWGEEVGSNVVEVHIHSLRRKLGADLIRNVRGVGYRIPEDPA
jgi:two-component system, OmpR family, response regulator QseB